MPIDDAACGVLEQPVQYFDPAAQVSPEERQERPAIPRSERSYTDASSAVITDPIVMACVDLVIEVVRLGQPGQKRRPIVGERVAGFGFLQSGSEPPWCVAGDSAQDRLTVGAKVRAEQCEQFENDCFRDLVGNLRSLSATVAVADLHEHRAVALHEPAFLFRRSRGAFGGGRRPFLGEAIGRRACCNETLAKPDAQPVTSSTHRNDVAAQPVSEQTLGVLAPRPRCVVFEQQRDDRLDRGYIDDAVVSAVTLIDQARKPSQACGVGGDQAGPCVPEHRFGIGEREQGFTGHVTPASSVTCVDEPVEGLLQRSESAA